MTDVPARGRLETVDLSVGGMDCGGCAATVRKSIAVLPGVAEVEVLLAAEKARVTVDPSLVTPAELRRAVEQAGYRCPTPDVGEGRAGERDGTAPGRAAPRLMALVAGAVLAAVVAGEWMGLFAVLTRLVPLWAGALLVLAFGWPVFRNVLLNALHGRVVSHALMSVGAVAALGIGEWVTAALVVFFMRVGQYAESFTSRNARSSLRELSSLAPRHAWVERDGNVERIPVERVRVGDTVVVRPGEMIPVDGVVLDGQAALDRSSITGESALADASVGTEAFASTLVHQGSLRVRAAGVGSDTTFARIVRQVEEAEANRGSSQRLADRFAAWYLPLVASIALATYLLSSDALAAVAVTVVACSCAFALATPVAMLASIGAAARRGLLIKGGKHIEALAKADVLLLDKTGTVTRGVPTLTDVVPLADWSEAELLGLAAAAERDSEHPVARAVRSASRARGLDPGDPRAFEAMPGVGVRALVGDRLVEVGSRRLLADGALPGSAAGLEAQGKTLLFVKVDGVTAGVLAVADTLRPHVADVLAGLRRAGFGQIELLTGDNEGAAGAVAGELGIGFRAGLLPHEKVEVVEGHQAAGRTVVMIGDGVNDAPALAQADVGIAMGAAGSEVALEVAHVALMGDDWRRLPELFALARRTMGVVKGNIGFTAVYNLVGISLAAVGLLPPIYAAALQSIPDLGIMGNSTRLLRYRASSNDLQPVRRAAGERLASQS